MSLSAVRSSCVRKPCFRPAGVSFLTPKRHLHRAHDRRYLELWKKQGVDYNQAVRRDTGSHLYNSPALVERILRALTVSKLQGRVSFLHATPASAKVLMKLYEAAYPSKGTNPFFKYLRSPHGIEGKATLAKARTWIPKAEVREPKPGLLSQSYALTCGVRPLETAASWGFYNHGGNKQYHDMMDLYRSFLQDTGIAEDDAVRDYFLAKGGELIRKYNRLKVGDFLVMGLPKASVDRYVYDCKPFNVPTGKNALDVAEHPERHADSLMSEKTHMTTMLLCEETLHPDCGISIVDASNPAEAETFCAGHTLAPMKDVEAFQDLVSKEPTDFEKEQEGQKKKVDAELDAFIKHFHSYRQTGKIDSAVLKAPIEELFHGDLPERMI